MCSLAISPEECELTLVTINDFPMGKQYYDDDNGYSKGLHAEIYEESFRNEMHINSKKYRYKIFKGNMIIYPYDYCEILKLERGSYTIDLRNVQSTGTIEYTGCVLKKLPLWLGCMTFLQKLYLPGNLDMKSMDGVCLPYLEKLDMSHGGYKRMPRLICPELRRLNLNRNRITSNGTTDLFMYPKLIVLNLGSNLIKNIIDVISSLKELEHLDISENLVECDPGMVLIMFPKLKTLVWSGASIFEGRV